MKRLLVMNDKDNVGVLLEKANAGDECIYNGEIIKIMEDIEFGHKVALKDLNEEDIVYKYGEEIGHAMEEIAAGKWVHNHNMGCRRGK